ncbi:hypothetical protein [Pontibacter burrus]|uniref:Uncharacterized protein n=1 Tax=Pontibacter burrus TaxID=2704466 RepID=A0A6B3LWC4_9BACT|nr:hypothetical protein [Pontibacter burrus]NEM98188.1 hypothetical protein [Pontibacter burrus]
MLSLFLLGGGGFAIVREMLWLDAMRPGWLVAATLLVLAGAAGLAICANLIPLRETYFSMNSSRLGYRLTFFGRKQELFWTQIRAVMLTDEKVVFELRNEKELVMPLHHIPDSKIARHIQASISLAAMEQNIKVNGVLAQGKARLQQA